MSNAPWFARPRALKLMASLCVLCALAFMLGQETAAYHAVQLQLQTDAATAHASAPPIPAISTAAAHGSRLAASHMAPAAVFIASGAGNGQVGQHGKHGQHDKHDKHDKQHDAQQHAAGDSSHGGMSHHGGDSHHHDSHEHDG